MPYLARSQVNSVSILALFAVDDDGFLYDPASVSFRIWDRTAGAQVFPSSGYEDVTSAGRVDVGSFYAFDTGTGQGWAPDSGATVGAYRIDWRFTDSEGVATRTWSQGFDIYTAGVEIPYWTYVTPNRIRAEGIDTSILTDEMFVRLVVRAQQLIERECRQPFRPIRQTLTFDGLGGIHIPVPVPIIGLESLKVNESDQVLDQSAYTVYASPALGGDPGWRSTDNRRNPKIQVKSASWGSRRPGGIFTPDVGRRGFGPSTKGNKAKGVFGFLEADGTTPSLIEDAMLRIVLATAITMDVGPGGQGTALSGPISSERTDQHEIGYAFSYTASSLDSPLATSQEVLDILRRYRAPIAIASPATRW